VGLVGWLRIQRPLLTIKTDNSDVTVQASLSLNGINDMPDIVTFYYSGDPVKKFIYKKNITQYGVPFSLLLFLSFLFGIL